jgi:Uma2 family endonuclease
METTLDISLMHLTDKQFYQFCEANRDLRLELSATGELFVEVLKSPLTLAGEDVLFGFELDLTSIW